GSITGSQPANGSATYVPGSASGTDRIRATSAAGPTQDLLVPVFPNPVRYLTARFSNSDVWHCRFDGKRDPSHLFANDTDSALATAGLRASTATAGDLGVFVDEIVYYFNSSYSNTQLPANPVGASDVAALKALLYGTASPGGRYTEIRRVGEGLGRTMAAVAAHEIGHSL